MKCIRLIRPAGHERQDLLKENIAALRQAGFEVINPSASIDSSLPYQSSTRESRISELNDVLCDEKIDIAWCVRGGYGCSDIIERLDWQRISQAQKHCIVAGFSDVTALHSALLSRCSWQGLHAPMPGGELWPGNSEALVVMETINAVQRPLGQEFKLKLEPRSDSHSAIDGILFGGCFSVLTNLIGTPYFPKLQHSILFLEDINENAERLIRYLNQWQMSGSLKEVQAIILGEFVGCLEDHQNFDAHILKPIQERVSCPVFKSSQFGHIKNNFPLGIGCQAKIADNQLTWSFNATISV